MAIELTKKDEIIDVDLGGDVILTCKAFTGELYQSLKFKVMDIVNKIKQEQDSLKEQGLPVELDLADKDIRVGVYQHIYNVELAKAVIVKWQGVLLDGEPAELTPENIAMLFEDGPLQDMFISKYEQPVRIIEEEKSNLRLSFVAFWRGRRVLFKV